MCVLLCGSQNTRCPKHERPRFLKDWAYDATMYIYDKLLPREFQLSLKPPDKSLVEEIISKYDPDPECGRWQKVGDRHVWERNISQPEDLIVVVCKVFKVSIPSLCPRNTNHSSGYGFLCFGRMLE